MENRKFVKFFILIFILGFFVVINNSAFAYGEETHAFLTNEVVAFYNRNFPISNISGNLANYLIDGSRREDDPPRWFNHFYDPFYNRGLTYDPAIDALNVGNWQKSKDWSQDSDNQTKLAYSSVIATILSSLQSWKIQKYFPTSDFTWNEAIRYWVNGEKEMAMFTLGHILHLIEDKTVPDHTRNDPHPGDSPYEIYTAQFNLKNPDQNLNQRLIANKLSVVDSNNLNSFFDELAKYSNNNFYSKDTIGIQSGYKYPEPDYFKILSDGRNYGMRLDKEFGEYPLIKASGVLEIKKDELLNRPLIMSAYWSRLSTKAVQYGTGVINLFFQEVEKYKNDSAFVAKEDKSFWSQAVDAVSGVVNSVTDAVTGTLPTPETINNFNPVPFEQAIANNIQEVNVPTTASNNLSTAPPSGPTDVSQTITSLESQIQNLQNQLQNISTGGGSSQAQNQTAQSQLLQNQSQVAQSSAEPMSYGGYSSSYPMSAGWTPPDSPSIVQNNPLTPLPEIPNFNVSYSTSTYILSFSWNIPIINSTSTINYILSDITSATSSLVVNQTILTSATSTVNDFGRNYKFGLIAKNENNTLLSQEVIKEINIPALPELFPLSSLY